MKIVCDNCSAKYSIADEKVAGKVFKIRCKKCTSVIVVRGDQQEVAEAPAEASAPAQAAAANFDYGSDAIWHAVIDGDQQGPFAVGQLQEMVGNGQIDRETYVWREGFEGWLALGEVSELSSTLGAGDEAGYSDQDATQVANPFATAGAAAAPTETAAAATSADPFSDTGDPFGGAAGASDPFGGAAAASDPFGGGDPQIPFGSDSPPAADPFGAGASAAGSPFSSEAGGGMAAGAAMAAASAQPAVVSATVGAPADSGPQVSGQQIMTGARNENSVLFSLSNLQALASDGNEGAAATPTAAPVSAGMATGDGSGLIDIRSLAGAAGLGGPSAAKDDTADLMSIGGGAGAFNPALAAPVLAPPVEESTGMSKGMLIGLIAAASLVVVLLIALIVVLTSKDEEPVAAVAPGTAMPAAAPGAPVAAPGPAPAAAGVAHENAAEKAAAAEEKAPADEASETAKKAVASSGSKKRRSGTKSGGAASTPAPAPAPKKRGGDDIDDLLAAATKKTKPKTNSNLPDKPSRSAVGSALKAAQAKMGSCGGSGSAKTKVVFKGSTGRVVSAKVSGPLAGTPAGKCVEKKAKTAKVPPFKQASLSVTYPFRL